MNGLSRLHAAGFIHRRALASTGGPGIYTTELGSEEDTHSDDGETPHSIPPKRCRGQPTRGRRPQNHRRHSGGYVGLRLHAAWHSQGGGRGVAAGSRWGGAGGAPQKNISPAGPAQPREVLAIVLSWHEGQGVAPKTRL